MLDTTVVRRRAFVPALLLLEAALAAAQELPQSGVTGFDYFYATSPGGTSSLYYTNVHLTSVATPVAPPVNAVPSRWAHRRRTLGALETALSSPARGVFLTPMGTAVGNGAIHFVDLRAGVVSQLVPTGNPAGYDLGELKRLKYVFSAEDDGAGGTTLRGFSYAAVGALVPLSPPALTLAGTPAAYVNRIGVDEQTLELHVPTAGGIHVLRCSTTAPHVAPIAALPTGASVPATNPSSFERNGTTTWIVGTTTFTGSAPTEAGYFAWDSSGATTSGLFGPVPGVPGKSWVPAAGTEELAIVGNGIDTYVYYLLREPPPGTFFIKPSAIGVARYLGSSPPITSTILMTTDIGEPFANPAVSGSRVAFESSFGLPFTPEPPGGGEKISIVYSPLDPLGAASADGTLGIPAPLGGRISTKGMDRPIWSRDGSQVMAATSHFPGAPNPAVPGLEVLNVPDDVLLDKFSAPHTVVPNATFPNQSIVFPGAFDPRKPDKATALAGLSFFGNVFHDAVASLVLPEFGEVGQSQVDPVGFNQSPAIPNFRAILPPTFNDATASSVPIPASFGARRTTFNLKPDLGLAGLTMSAAMQDRILVQRSGGNVIASIGLTTPTDTQHVSLPSGWITTTEFFSQ